MEKKYRVAIIVLLVAIVFVLGYLLLTKDNVSTDCLRGNQAACAYFDAQEEVDRLREELNAAKASLKEARAAYKSNQ